jgi:uncharacterized membrane protein
MLRNGSPTRPDAPLIRCIWLLTLVLVLIAVAVVTRRTLSLFGLISTPSARSGSAALDATFIRYVPLTMVHISAGLLFLVLGPFQFIKTLRTRRPRLHRRIGYVVLTSGLVTGVTALAMTTRMAIGGATERAATTLFGLLFLVALVRAFACIRRRRVALHREWMIRAFSLGLAIATIRPIVGAFFATQRFTGLTPPEFFGIAFWLGFTMHLIAAEAWINHTRAWKTTDAGTVWRRGVHAAPRALASRVERTLQTSAPRNSS